MLQFPVQRIRLWGLLALVVAGVSLALPRAMPASAANALITVCPSGPPVCQYASIQDALNASVDGDQIVVAAGTYNGGLTIATSVMLLGAGPGQTIINGGAPVVTVLSGTSVKVRGVTITGGVFSPARAGGIRSDGTLTLEDAAVTGNTGLGGGGVGGIYSNGTLILNRSAVDENTGNDAGGILNAGGVLTLNGSEIGYNHASGGAGIKNEGGALRVTDSTIRGNFADNFSGGGIANYGGTLALTRSAVTDNYSASEGGGLFTFGTATITDSTLSGNSASYGGGIATGGVLTLRRSAVHDNATCCGVIFGVDGGGIYNFGTAIVLDSTVEGNATLRGSGGGIFNDSFATLTLRHTDVVGNTANSAPEFQFYGSGGGLYNAGTAELFQARIDANSAAGQGGGIDNVMGVLALKHSEVSENTAYDQGGTGIFGGGINNTLGTLTLRHSTVSGNIPDDCVGC
jgi:hypothetical protein